jgi:3-phenylpropionate/trans-cinnamate dioxygenase ferredoxin reductase component
MAGSACARELLAAGAEVTLIDTVPEATCELPPLSKSLFKETLDTVPLAGSAHGLDYRQALVTAADPIARTVTVDDSVDIEYSQLVIATGMNGLPYPGQLPGGPAFTLHSLAEAEAIRAALAASSGHSLAASAGRTSAQQPSAGRPLPGHTLTGQLPTGTDIGIVGSGYLALELARGAVEAGHRATVYLRRDRPLSFVSTEMATTLMDLHAQAGVQFVPESTPDDYSAHELWLVAIGAQANTEFLPAALPREITGALHVDEHLRVAPDLYALGDASRITAGPMAAYGRLESEPMASSQGRWLGRHLAGATAEAWADVPWHWSFQGPVRVFTAGMSAGIATGTPVVLGEPDAKSFQVALFAGDESRSPLVGVETLGTPQLHNAAKKVLAQPQVPTREEVLAPGFDMRASARGQ